MQLFCVHFTKQGTLMQKSHCRICNPKAFCSHNIKRGVTKSRSACIICNPKAFCKHGRRGSCKICGIGFCKHGKLKWRCKDCGKGYCEHGRYARRCRDCGAGYCKHDRLVFACKDCGTGLCEHGRRSNRCVDCGGLELWARGLAKRAKNRARKANLPYDLTLDWIVEELKKGCPVFNVPFVHAPKSGRLEDFSASLDKFIPRLGYTKENTRVISWLANKIKSDGTTEQVRTVADWMESVERSNKVSIEITTIQ